MGYGSLSRKKREQRAYKSLMHLDVGQDKRNNPPSEFALKMMDKWDMKKVRVKWEKVKMKKKTN